MLQRHEIVKQRAIRFTPLPPDQASRALTLLSGLEGLEVRPGRRTDCIEVTYSILDYTLEGLEDALTSQGFRLENSLLARIGRALVYYCEDCQRSNLKAPERLETAREREIFAIAYEHHAHGDRDETPAEWREYR